MSTGETGKSDARAAVVIRPAFAWLGGLFTGSVALTLPLAVGVKPAAPLLLVLFGIGFFASPLLARWLNRRVATRVVADEPAVPLAVTTRPTPVVWLFCAACAATFALQVYVGTGWLGHVSLGANTPMLVRAGEWWRLLTATLLHGGFPHLGMNLSAIFVLGLVIEQSLGSARTLVLITVTAAAGAGASAVFGASLLSVGASTAVFGLLGALLALQLSGSDALHPGQRLTPGRWAVVLGLNALISFLPLVDAWAHAGGFFAGVIAALALARAGAEPGPRWRVVLRAGASACAVLWVAAVALQWSSPSRHAPDATLHAMVTAAASSEVGYSASVRNALAWEAVRAAGAPDDVLRAAAALARAAVAAAPDEPAFRDTRAMALYRLGRHAEAVAEQRRAIERVSAGARRREYRARLSMFERALSQANARAASEAGAKAGVRSPPAASADP